MKIPPALHPLLEDGFIDGVVRQLQSGKEATVYIVEAGEELLCAKVYKDARRRSFQKAADYSEGRKTRRSRDARARNRRSRHGRAVQEAEWKVAEFETLLRLREAEIIVPRPHGMYEGVLLMELVVDDDGDPAPRLSDVPFVKEAALDWHECLMEQIIRMLLADVIHGDLSEYNVLASWDGPVIIDVPQAVAAGGNNHALRLLARDVTNITAAFAKWAPELRKGQYALELWDLYERGELTEDTVLTGEFTPDERRADVAAVLAEIEEARLEAEAREEAYQEMWGE